MDLKELNRLAVVIKDPPKKTTKLTRKEAAEALKQDQQEFDEEEWVDCGTGDQDDEDLAIALGLLDDAANLLVALADPHLNWGQFVKGRKSMQTLGDEIYKFMQERERRAVLDEILAAEETLDGEVKRGNQ